MSAEKKTSTTPQLDAQWSAAKKRAMTAYDARDPLAMVEAETEADMLWLKRELVHDVQRLAHRLSWLADAIETDANYVINSVGEIQSSGPAIDTRCAEIAKLHDVLRGIESAKRASAEKTS